MNDAFVAVLFLAVLFFLYLVIIIRATRRATLQQALVAYRRSLFLYAATVAAGIPIIAYLLFLEMTRFQRHNWVMAIAIVILALIVLPLLFVGVNAGVILHLVVSRGDPTHPLTEVERGALKGHLRYWGWVHWVLGPFTGTPRSTLMNLADAKYDPCPTGGSVTGVSAPKRNGPNHD